MGVSRGKIQHDAAFIGAIGNELVLTLTPSLAPQAPGYGIEQGRFSMTVLAAQASDVDASEIQGGSILAVAEEVFEAEA